MCFASAQPSLLAKRVHSGSCACLCDHLQLRHLTRRQVFTAPQHFGSCVLRSGPLTVHQGSVLLGTGSLST
eukprot:11936396-Karenia_brevis.AAC.1